MPTIDLGSNTMEALEADARRELTVGFDDADDCWRAQLYSANGARGGRNAMMGKPIEDSAPEPPLDPELIHEWVVEHKLMRPALGFGETPEKACAELDELLSRIELKD